MDTKPAKNLGGLESNQANRSSSNAGCRPIELFVPEIRLLLDSKSFVELKNLLSEINSIDLADGFSDFSPEQQLLIFKLLSAGRMMEVFEELEFPEQEYLIQHMGDQTLAPFLADIPDEVAAKLFKKLPESMVKKMTNLMRRERVDVVEEIMDYPPHTVGGIMRTHFIHVEPDTTARATMALLQARSRVRAEEDIHFVFVTTEGRKLLGGVALRTLIAAPNDIKMKEIMSPMSPIRIPVNMDREEASEIFKRYKTIAAPVVDENNKLLGVLDADDVLQVMEEESTEDIQMLGGSEALEDTYFETSFGKMIKKRGTWLCVLFIGETLTATAMTYFEAEIAKAVVLVLFIPLIISSGGNSGSQAATLIVRALALKEVTFKDWIRVMRREMLTGLTLGSILGIIGFFRIFVWAHIFPNVYGPHYLRIGFSVGTALVGVVLWGSVSGSLFPIILKRLKFDPAVASAPFVATLVDVTGLIIYFSVAAVLLKGILL